MLTYAFSDIQIWFESYLYKYFLGVDMQLIMYIALILVFFWISVPFLYTFLKEYRKRNCQTRKNVVKKWKNMCL